MRASHPLSRKSPPFTMLLVLAFGCAGTEIGNPVQDTELALSAFVASSDGDAGVAGAVIVEEVWVALGDVRFVLDDDCSRGQDTRVTVPGPIIAELLGDPERLTVPLVEDDYCQVRVPLRRAAAVDDGQPQALVGQTVLVTGRRADDAPFSIRSRDMRELRLRTRGESLPLGGAGEALVLAFDVRAWLEGVNLGAAPLDDDGSLRVDADSNRELLVIFEANLRTSLALYRDFDADGRLDTSEQSEPLTEPDL